MAAEGRLPVELVGGFLGSGKTTLLRRRYAGDAGARAAVIVNEFGEIPLDQRMAETTGASIRVIAGGCVCCDRREELVQVLREVVSDWDRGVDTDRVVIETSGVADPGPVVAAVAADPMLRHRCRVERVTVTVDAQAGEAELGFPPELRRQIAMADELVLTKADLVSGETLERLAEGLRALGSPAPIGVAVDGRLMPEPSWPALDSGVSPAADPAADPAPHADSFAAVSISTAEPLDWDAFAVWLSMLLQARGDDVPRMKGIASVAGASPVAINSVGRTVHPPEHLAADAAADRTELVFVTRGVRAGLLERSLAAFQRI
jgi:G3E family GTPase